MTALVSEVEIQLREDLERERDRADRAEIEAIIAWEALALMREIVVKHKFNITMHRVYEPIKALEGCRIHQEVDRRFKEKREREEAIRAKRIEAFLDNLPSGEMDMEHNEGITEEEV